MIDQDGNRDLTTRADFRFRVRPVNLKDEPALAEFFTHVTEDDLPLRFRTGINEVGPLAALTEVDHRQKENFPAIADDDGTLIASAMLARNAAHETGVVAIVTRSDCKGRGSFIKHASHPCPRSTQSTR